MTTLVRGSLGIGAGMILAYVFAEYAGFGATVTSHLLGGYVAQMDSVTYAWIGAFCAIVAVLIVATACLLVLEFVRPPSRSRRVVAYVILGGLGAFAILHLVAARLEFVGRHLDPLPAVIGALSTNAWLSLVVVAVVGIIVRDQASRSARG